MKGFGNMKIVIISELGNQKGFTKEIFMLCFEMKGKV